MRSIEVSPLTATVPLGTSFQFHATALLTDGNRLDVTTLATWTSSDDGKLTVVSGLARALATTSTVTVEASYSGSQGSAQVVLSDATLNALSLQPALLTLPKGSAQDIVATGTFSDGAQRIVTTDAAWASSDVNVATVNQGHISAIGTGNTSISASLQGKTAQLKLTVTDATLLRLELEPAGLNIPKGVIGNLHAIGIYTDNTRMDLTESASWVSQDSQIAFVSNTSGTRGHVLGLGVGVTDVQSSIANVTATASVNVTSAQLLSIAVVPGSQTLPIGLQIQLGAQGQFTDGSSQNLTNQVTWSSTEPNIITVSNADGSQGLATAVNVGNSTIQATLSGIFGQTQITTVDAVAIALNVTPQNIKMTTGVTQTFTANATFSDHSIRDVSNNTVWTTSNVTLASISPLGNLTALAAGNVSVEGSFQGVVADSSIIINSPTFLDKLWVGEIGLPSENFSPALVVFEPTTMHLETPAALNILLPDRQSAYDPIHQRIYIASSLGLNVMSASNGTHLLGSPYHSTGPIRAGTLLFPSTMNRKGFAAAEVAYDGDLDRVYLATTFGLYVFEAPTMTTVAGSPFPASTNDSEATGVCYDSTRKQIYVLTSRDGTVTGDSNAISIFDPATLTSVAGSPFIPPGIQTLMYGQMMLDERRGKLYTSDVDTFTEFDVATKAFTTRQRQGPFVGGTDTIYGQTYIAQTDVLAMCDINRNQLQLYTGATLAAVPGSPIDMPEGPRQVTYDSYSNCYYVSTFRGIVVIDATNLQRTAGSPFAGPIPPTAEGYNFIIKVP